MIDEFVGRYAFLSNQFRIDVELDGFVYPTVTHALEAARTNDPIKRDNIRKAHSPGLAKALGRSITNRPGWLGDRVDVLKGLLIDKFGYQWLAERLLETGNVELVEGTGHEDDFWGVFVFEDGSRRGQNVLGKTLMEIRSGLKQL